MLTEGSGLGLEVIADGVLLCSHTHLIVSIELYFQLKIEFYFQLNFMSFTTQNLSSDS